MFSQNPNVSIFADLLAQTGMRNGLHVQNSPLTGAQFTTVESMSNSRRSSVGATIAVNKNFALHPSLSLCTCDYHFLSSNPVPHPKMFWTIPNLVFTHAAQRSPSRAVSLTSALFRWMTSALPVLSDKRVCDGFHAVGGADERDGRASTHDEPELARILRQFVRVVRVCRGNTMVSAVRETEGEGVRD